MAYYMDWHVVRINLRAIYETVRYLVRQQSPRYCTIEWAVFLICTRAIH